MFVEVAAELERRRGAYPGFVAKGRMTRADADRELRVWSAIFDTFLVGEDRARATGATASWTEQVHALRREIALRRQFYPGWVAGRRLTREQADRKLELVESLHDLTWTHTQSEEAIAARLEASTRLAA